MFLCDGAKIGLSRAAWLTICVPMHENNISVDVADAYCWFLLLVLKFKINPTNTSYGMHGMRQTEAKWKGWGMSVNMDHFFSMQCSFEHF